jgi:sterol desaturase/sphingolipid hydroxylase (fatty acid hydroxylase superfamily)
VVVKTSRISRLTAKHRIEADDAALSRLFALKQIMWVIVVLLMVAYFLPTLNAWERGHHNTRAIAVLNRFLGWTLIGWVAALVWSFTATERKTAY